MLLAASAGVLLNGCGSTPVLPMPSAQSHTAATVAAITPDTVRLALLDFLAGWKTNDVPRMRKFAGNETIRGFFDGDGRARNYSFRWTDGCAIGPLGRGRCEFLVYGDEDEFAMIYRFEYSTGPGGITIDNIVFGGDAG